MTCNKSDEKRENNTEKRKQIHVPKLLKGLFQESKPEKPVH